LAILFGREGKFPLCYEFAIHSHLAIQDGGLCGEILTRHMAASEFVDGSGRWVFKLAAFSGEAAPPSGADPVLCRAYSYTAD
jgi:hypothetical protein